jgi:hypothetical protein
MTTDVNVVTRGAGDRRRVPGVANASSDASANYTPHYV